MPLVDLKLSIGSAALPGDVRSFLREAERRIERLQMHGRFPGFVPSDFETSFRVLRALAATAVVPGTFFCEWGSGVGVVACLAAMLDYDAYGIEIEEDLVSAAQELAADFDLPVEFIRDSFIPRGAQVDAGCSEPFAWLNTDESNTEEQLGLAVDDFGVVFAYPWPDEERLTGDLFERYAHVGAVLVTYHGGEDFRLRRKIFGKPVGDR
jgi:hypothetical protein